MITVNTRQAAVGQGGFMTQEIVVDRGGWEPRLFIAFDCGSLNREPLYESIDAIDSGVLDILFISHLDADHVNGIDFLLNKKSVETVVLPYLDPLHTTIMVCRSLASAGVSGDFKTFLESPVRWFVSRGVKRVIFITRDNDGGDGPPPPRPDDPDVPDPYTVESQSEAGARIAYTVASRGPQQLRREQFGSIDVIVTTPVTDFKLHLGSAARPHAKSPLSWMLLPYVHPFDSERLALFLRAVNLKISFDPGLADRGFTKRLLKALGDPKIRHELRRCYDLLASDHNEVSLSLYSGPGPSDDSGWNCCPKPWWSHQACRVQPTRVETRGPGWICTGDANLKLRRTLTPWLSRHSTLFDHVSVFVLPHHGSAISLASDVLDRLGPITYLACAARGRKHHPHSNVTAHLRQRGFGLWQVSERADTSFGTSAYTE
jgi:hypothetical protein